MSATPEKWDKMSGFYREVVDAQVIDRGGGRFAFRWGTNQIMVLVGVATIIPTGAPILPGAVDMCFVWPGPIEDAVAHLSRHGILVVAGPAQRSGAGGNGQSVHFNDPEGNLLEFISYR